MKIATKFPDVYSAKQHAATKCEEKRKTSKYGFPYHFSYDRVKEEWTKVLKPAKTGTPCESYLWELDSAGNEISWTSYSYEPVVLHETMTQSPLQAGLFEIEIQDWVIGEI